MKYILLPAIALLFLSCQGNLKEKPKPQHSETDWAYYELNDDVKSIKTRSTKIEGGTDNSDIDINTDRTFDDYGYLTNDALWDKNNQPMLTSVLQGKDLLLKKTQYTAGKPTIITENQWDAAKENLLGTLRKTPDGKQIDRTMFVMENGKLKDEILYDNQDNIIQKISYGYDKEGNKKTEMAYLDGRTLSFKVLYEYDGNNNKISEARYNAEKELYKTTYTYNGKNVIKKQTIGSTGKPDYTESMQYNDKNKVTLHTTIEHGTGIETTETSEYNNNNKIVNWTTKENDQPQINIKNVFDANDNLISTTTMQTGNVLSERTYEYKYDSHKNWIKKTITINGVKSYEINREISYY
jgi:hypothetical protein